jgi:hypothetical protein
MKKSKFVGTGVNRKTAARSEMRPTRSSSNVLSGRKQLEQFNQQSPEPFRNPAPGARLTGVQTHPAFRAGNGRAFASSLREISSRPMSQSAMNVATGHAPDYRPAGYRPETSGRPMTGVRRIGSGTAIPEPTAKQRAEYPGIFGKSYRG